ncbi:hypothetical protein NDU88_005397 [Pleurodeles waltl]|uniref:Uncharacterized protein n=1 Tax=Pleurodeles waltl TaxID=8319 RepID=A0AAV7M974_PLEWA|nr:hypothetical protein NDU88_005397 [Pleurodeles waltl]
MPCASRGSRSTQASTTPGNLASGVLVWLESTVAEWQSGHQTFEQAASSWSTVHYSFPGGSGGSKRNGGERRSPPPSAQTIQNGTNAKAAPGQTRGATRPGSTPWPVPGLDRLAQDAAMPPRNTDMAQSIRLIPP